jgi:hypothetical protein
MKLRVFVSSWFNPHLNKNCPNSWGTLAQWQVELQNDAVSDTTEADSSN